MLDIQQLRSNLDAVAAGLSKRGKRSVDRLDQARQVGGRDRIVADMGRNDIGNVVEQHFFGHRSVVLAWKMIAGPYGRQEPDASTKVRAAGFLCPRGQKNGASVSRPL